MFRNRGRNRFSSELDVMARRGFYIDSPAPAPSGGGSSGNGQGTPAAGGPGTPDPGAGGLGNQPQPGSFGPFQSADEVWKGYQELQKTFTNTSQQLKDMVEWRKKVESTFNPAGGGEQFDSEAWLGEFAQNPRDAIMKIINPTLQSQHVAQMREKVNSNLEKLRAKFKDFAELEPEMQAQVESGAFSSIDPVALETLYHGIKARKEFIEKAKAAGAAGAPQVPGVDGGAGSGVPGSVQYSEEQLRTMPMAELQKLAEAAK